MLSTRSQSNRHYIHDNGRPKEPSPGHDAGTEEAKGARVNTRSLLLSVLIILAGGLPVSAHMLYITQARVDFDESDQFKAEIDVDFSRPMGSSDAYYQLSTLPHDQQQAEIQRLVEPLLDDLQFTFGGQVVRPVLTGWDVPKATRAVYNDYYVGR